MSTSLEDVLSRDIKLRFLQLIAPGQVYPERSPNPNTHKNRTASSCSLPDNSSQQNGALSPGSGPVPPLDTSTSSVQKEPHRKKFDVEQLGLSWDAVDTMHFFVFPGNGL